MNHDLNIKELVGDVSITDKKKNYIDNYVYNSIVNHALYKYNNIYNTVKTKKQYEKITFDDLIQEIVYQNSKDKEILNDKLKRKNILNNYFKGSNIRSKFPNKYKIENALKRINYEREQASLEFSKLFDYDNKQKH